MGRQSKIYPSKHLETDQSAETFQKWWEQTKGFFTDQPSYKVYKKLYSLGVDLDYVEFLRMTFTFFDRVFQSWSRPPPKSRQQFSLSTFDHYRPFFEWFGESVAFQTASTIKNFYEKYREETIDPIVDSSGEPFQKLIIDRVVTSAIKVCRAVISAHEEKPKRTKADQLDMINKLVEVINSHYEKRFSLGVLLKYALVAQAHKTGRKPDVWGSLLLLSLTEHFREKAKKPLYPVAGELLRIFRNDPAASRFQQGTTAKVRVANFKRLNPDWKNAVEPLRNLYLSEKSK
jgi:hypothetical protein